jgi:transcriptional regulator with XRE-family HTH domain
VDTKDSIINREMALTIKRERAGTTYTVDQLAKASGISTATINRMFSKDPRDVNITQITWLAALLGTTPQELVAEAVRRAGGLGAIMDEMRASIEMSDGAGTNDELDRKRRQKEAASMTTEQLEGEQQRAATRDPEMDSDEPPTP